MNWSKYQHKRHFNCKNRTYQNRHLASSLAEEQAWKNYQKLTFSKNMIQRLIAFAHLKYIHQHRFELVLKNPDPYQKCGAIQQFKYKKEKVLNMLINLICFWFCFCISFGSIYFLHMLFLRVICWNRFLLQKFFFCILLTFLPDRTLLTWHEYGVSAFQQNTSECDKLIKPLKAGLKPNYDSLIDIQNTYKFPDQKTVE